MTSENPRVQPTRHTELAAFLRTRRARLTPADVGLVTGSASSRRRTQGLRREEVAQLSGVGVTWYTWLEQGREISASAQVIDALARAVLLDQDQHRHLRELAGPPPPEPRAADDEMLTRLQLLVDAVMPSPASVYDSHFDYEVWNHAYARVRQDPASLPPGKRNMLWMMFTDAANRARMVRWESAAQAVRSQSHTAVGRSPEDSRFAELVTALTEAAQRLTRREPEESPCRNSTERVRAFSTRSRGMRTASRRLCSATASARHRRCGSPTVRHWQPADR